MSLILCPECGTKISDKATKCPYCGFHSADSERPISEQNKYEIVPIFEYEIEEWKPNRGELSVISYEDNKNLIEYFGNWKTIQVKLPAIAEVISTMANKEHVMIAKMDNYVKKLIDKGIYRFTIDKQGEILPTIRGADGFVKQVRLENMVLTPNLTQSLNNLSMHAVMAQILDEIEYVGDAIREIHIGLQNDRLAMAESARDKLKQARMIQDSRLREIALIGAVNSATDAKRILMRNFSQNMSYIIEHSHKSNIQLILSPKGERDISQKAIDSFQALVYITNVVQTECEGYAMLGEYEPCRECLSEFKTFIEKNGLNKRDTLLLLNENSSKKRIEVVDEFSDIATRISVFDTSAGQIEYRMHELLTVTEEGGAMRMGRNKSSDINKIKYCKKCGCELSSTNKYKHCDNCRRETTVKIRDGVIVIAGVLGSVAVVLMTKGKNSGSEDKE